MKKLLAIVLFGLVINVYAMEQSKESQRKEIRKTIDAIKEKKRVTEDELLGSIHAVISHNEEWYKIMVSSLLTSQENKSLYSVVNNALPDEECIQKDVLSVIKKTLPLNEDDNTEEISPDISIEDREEKAQEAYKAFIGSMLKRGGVDENAPTYFSDFQEACKKNLAKLIFDHFKRKKGIVSELQAVNAPHEVERWTDEVYLPCIMHEYLDQNWGKEEDLVEAIEQLSIDQKE